MENLHTDAKDKLLSGIKKTVGAVKATYGAAGSNVIIESDLRPFHRITNDGVTVAKAIELDDPVERVGANLIKEVAERSDTQSGDGTTTASILIEAIIEEGLKAEGISPMQLKKELDDCLPLIEASIDAQKRDITVDTVGEVATISAESEEIGQLIQEAYQTIGANGIIELDNSHLPTTFIEYTDGVRLRFAGYLGEYSTTKVGVAEYEEPLILVSKEKITKIDQLEAIGAKLLNAKKDFLVIYCEDIDMGVASKLAYTHIKKLVGKMQGEEVKGIRTLVIKAPTLWKDWLYEDISKLTGATPIDFANGKTFENVTLNDLGTCEKIISTKEETRLIGTKDISEHLATLEEASKTDDQQKIRKSWLNTKVAVIKLGANSDSELSYKRLKVIDAISASKLALKGGIVAGGGMALLNATTSLPDTIGGHILTQALYRPQWQIMANAGAYWKETTPPFTGSRGFNVKTGKEVDMFEAKIIDPAIVVKNSLRNALSVASTVLTAGSVITLNKQEPPKMPYG